MIKGISKKLEFHIARIERITLKKISKAIKTTISRIRRISRKER
jgi:hypothetical protein